MRENCFTCVWLLHFIQEREVECIKNQFGRTRRADFRAREGCELWETFGDALARLEAEQKRRAA